MLVQALEKERMLILKEIAMHNLPGSHILTQLLTPFHHTSQLSAIHRRATVTPSVCVWFVSTEPCTHWPLYLDPSACWYLRKLWVAQDTQSQATFYNPYVLKIYIYSRWKGIRILALKKEHLHLHQCKGVTSGPDDLFLKGSQWHPHGALPFTMSFVQLPLPFVDLLWRRRGTGHCIEGTNKSSKPFVLKGSHSVFCKTIARNLHWNSKLCKLLHTSCWIIKMPAA